MPLYTTLNKNPPLTFFFSPDHTCMHALTTNHIYNIWWSFDTLATAIMPPYRRRHQHHQNYSRCSFRFIILAYIFSGFILLFVFLSFYALSPINTNHLHHPHFSVLLLCKNMLLRSMRTSSAPWLVRTIVLHILHTLFGKFLNAKQLFLYDSELRASLYIFLHWLFIFCV